MSHQEFGATIGKLLVEASANEHVPKVAKATKADDVADEALFQAYKMRNGKGL